MFNGLGVCLLLSLVAGLRSLALPDSYEIDIVNRLALSSQSLTTDISYKYCLAHPGVTYVTSIPPLMSALAEMVTGSNGYVKTQLLEILNLYDINEVLKGFLSESAMLSKGEKYIGRFVGKVYADDEEPFCRKFTAIVESFLEETGVVDFDNPKRAADYINADIQRQSTLGFKKLVSPSDIDKRGGLVFVSLNELTVKLNHRLDAYYDKKYINFNNGKGDIQKLRAFTVKDYIKTAEIEELDANVHEFKIVGSDESLVIFYPNKPSGFEKIVEKIREPKLFNEVFDKLKKKCLQVTLPILNLRESVDLAESFRQVRNVSHLFTPGEGYFKGIQKKCSTYVSAILHETHIYMDSERPALPPSENDQCGEPYRKLELTHPFVFFIASRSEKILPIPVISVIYHGPE